MSDNSERFIRKILSYIGRFLMVVGAAVGLAFFSAVLIGLAGAGYDLYAEMFGRDVLYYSWKYKISSDHVHISKKPIDCDYYFAPVGYKGCQYKSVAKAYDKQGWLIAGDGAAIYSHDTKTGKPIVSDDNGKTWELIDPDDVPDPKVNSVVVSWVKVPD